MRYDPAVGSGPKPPSDPLDDIDLAPSDGRSGQKSSALEIELPPVRARTDDSSLALELAPLGGADEAPRPRTPSVEARTRTLPGAPPGREPSVPSKPSTPSIPSTPSMPSVALADAVKPEQPAFPRPKTPPAGSPTAPDPRAKSPSRGPLKDMPEIVETRRLRTPRDSGLVIRTRTPTASPPLKPTPAPEPAPTATPLPRKRAPSAEPVPPIPPALRGKISYTVTKLSLSAAGIEAVRENGTPVTVFWAEITSVVARTLPPASPYDGYTFVDIVSSTGKTMRLLPWTEVDGDLIAGQDVDRARSFVRLAAQRSPQAQFDEATSTFLIAMIPATPLADAAALAAHDRRVL